MSSNLPIVSPVIHLVESNWSPSSTTPTTKSYRVPPAISPPSKLPQFAEYANLLAVNIPKSYRRECLSRSEQYSWTDELPSRSHFLREYSSLPSPTLLELRFMLRTHTITSQDLDLDVLIDIPVSNTSSFDILHPLQHQNFFKHSSCSQQSPVKLLREQDSRWT